MKKIFNLVLFIIFFFSGILFLDAGFVICDSGNINYGGISESEICNGGYETKNVNDIKSFTGEYVDIKLGYFGNVNSIINNINITENTSLGFFDSNKKTITKKVNPNFSFPSGFIGFKNNNIMQNNISEKLPTGLFDSNKNTILKNTNPLYSFPVGFLGKHVPVIIKKKGKKAYNPVVNITYNDFFVSIFKKYTKFGYSKGGYIHYEPYEYENLIRSLMVLFGEGYDDINKTIPQISKNRIEWYIENNPNFKINLNNIVSNIREINYAFENTKSKNVKLFIVKYYLEK